MSFQRMLMLRERKHYELPQKEHLFALYVPRWQAVNERTVIKDYVGGYNLLPVGDVTWGGDLFFRADTENNYAVSQQFSYTVDKYTILADRDVNMYYNVNQLGIKLIYNLSNNFASEIVERYRSPQVIRCECGGTENQFPFSDVPERWTYQTSDVYNGLSLTRGARRAWRQIVIDHSMANRREYPMWTRIGAVAIWATVLTPEEIVQAEEYLTHVNNSRDFDE